MVTWQEIERGTGECRGGGLLLPDSAGAFVAALLRLYNDSSTSQKRSPKQQSSMRKDAMYVGSAPQFQQIKSIVVFRLHTAYSVYENLHVTQKALLKKHLHLVLMLCCSAR